MLTRYIVLFLMDLSTRRVHIAGMASQANGLWMAQVARNLTDDVDGFLRGKRYLFMIAIRCTRPSSVDAAGCWRAERKAATTVAQLVGWYRVPSSWPVNRTFDTFKRWFEYRFHSMLVDLCEDPLEHDEL